MSTDLEQKREAKPETLSPVVTEPPPSTDAGTKFTAGGKIPDVAPTATQGKTASELAFEPGPGVKALEALLAAGPAPDPDKVVDLIDAHRGETSAMFALLQQKSGAAYTAQVKDAMDLRISIKRREIVAGDPTNENGGYFIASQKDEGAKWKTAGGGFQGTAGKNGLDSTLRIDDNDSLHGKVDTKGNGTLAWEHDGKNVGELYKEKNEFGARKSWELESGTITGGLRNRKEGETSSNEVFGEYDSKDKKLNAELSAGVSDGAFATSLAGTYKPNATDSLTGRYTHDGAGDKFNLNGTKKLGDGTLTGSAEYFHHANGTSTGSIAGAYENKDRRFDASVTRNPDSTLFHVGDTEKTLAPNLTLNGSLDHLQKDSGDGQTTLRLGERYRSGNLVQGADLEMGRGERNYLNATGSLDTRLGPNFYAGAFGGFRMEEGHQTTGNLGASLTFTPHEKAALTLAGILDQSGAFETRLQLDVFKSRIDGLNTIADHKKDALVSLFVSYTTAGNRMMDNRYGAPTLSMPMDDNRVSAGIKIRF